MILVESSKLEENEEWRYVAAVVVGSGLLSTYMRICCDEEKTVQSAECRSYSYIPLLKPSTAS
jgi:hypothetical protein